MQIECIGDIVRAHSAAMPDGVALSLGERSVSWGELYERARRVATGLEAAGVTAQDRVAFLDKNGIEHFEVVYGAALGNAVCVDVNWRLAPPEVAFIVNDSAAKVLVVGPDFVPVLESIRDDLDARSADPGDRRTRRSTRATTTGSPPKLTTIRTPHRRPTTWRYSCTRAGRRAAQRA